MFAKLWATTVGFFLISLVSVTTPVTSLILKELPIENETLVWGLAGAVGAVSDQLSTEDEGIFPEHYTIKVKAGAKNHNLVLAGQVYLTLTTFSPGSGIAAGQGETWYVQDSQIIAEKGIASEAIRVRYDP